MTYYVTLVSGWDNFLRYDTKSVIYKRKNMINWISSKFKCKRCIIFDPEMPGARNILLHQIAKSYQRGGGAERERERERERIPSSLCTASGEPDQGM